MGGANIENIWVTMHSNSCSSNLRAAPSTREASGERWTNTFIYLDYYSIPKTSEYLFHNISCEYNYKNNKTITKH